MDADRSSQEEGALGAGDRISVFERAFVRSIPKGLRNKAQGCEGRATLGNREQGATTLKGLRPVNAHDAPEPGATPLGLRSFAFVPRVSRASQPWALGRNPVGIL